MLVSELGLPMHELGVAQSILDIVGQYVPREQGAAVRQVRVRIGEMAGVVADSLDFCFGAIVGESPYPQARLQIERVPLQGKCLDCSREFAVEHTVFLCPGCAGGNVHLVSGRELEILDIEMAEQESAV